MDNSKSSSCYMSMLSDAPIDFKSGLQGLTTMSNMKAELVTSDLAMKEAVFCANMLTGLEFGEDFAKLLCYSDNMATLHALGNRSFKCRTKHIALRFFFIGEFVPEKRISIHYIPTDINPADMVKHLNRHGFINLLDTVSNFNVNNFSNSQLNWSCYMFVCEFRICSAWANELVLSVADIPASYYHWLNEPCRTASHGSLVCAVAGSLRKAH